MASSFPNGFANGVSVRGLPVLNTYGGNVYWVDSGNGSNGNKGTYDRPFASIDYAIGRCTANNGDLIMVKPGHAETVSAASGIDMDVAGVTVVGLGYGDARPTITLNTATTATIDLAAASSGFMNCIFVANFADIAAMFTLSADDAFLIGCEFREAAANMNWVILVDAPGTTNNAYDRFRFNDNRVVAVDAANDQLIRVAADIDGLEVCRNYIRLGTANDEALIEAATGKDITTCLIEGNRILRFNTQGELVINADTTTACTGIMAHNLVGCLDTTGVVLIETGTQIMQFENYVTGVVDESGYLDPAAGADA